MPEDVARSPRGRPGLVGVGLVASVVDNEVRLIPVKVVRDHGTRIEVASSLKCDERLITNPSDTLRDGDAVEVAPPEVQPAK